MKLKLKEVLAVNEGLKPLLKTRIDKYGYKMIQMSKKTKEHTESYYEAIRAKYAELGWKLDDLRGAFIPPETHTEADKKSDALKMTALIKEWENEDVELDMYPFKYSVLANHFTPEQLLGIDPVIEYDEIFVDPDAPKKAEN